MWALILSILCVVASIFFFLKEKKPTTSGKPTPNPVISTPQPETVKKTEPASKIEQVVSEKKKEDGCGSDSCGNCDCKENQQPENSLKIFFASQSGSAKKWALEIAEQAKAKSIPASVVDLASYDADELTLETSILIFVVSTYTGGKFPDSCSVFWNWMTDLSLDFRVSKDHFKNLRYAIFGIGNKIYGKQFNKAAMDLDRIFSGLNGQNLTREVGSGDTDAGVEISEAFNPWVARLWKAIEVGSVNQTQKISEDADEDPDDDLDNEPLIDLEDIGANAKKSKPQTKGKRAKGKKKEAKPSKAEEDEEEPEEEEIEDEQDADGNPKDPRDMLTQTLRASLTKQGYRLLGSHSGVKTCRWTKAMLRGRGGCYKHTFYGIQSHQCMEMTPSLACANKCIFCWRHHSNPVGTHWKWKVDEPQFLLDAALAQNYSLIKQLKGVPGVIPERFDEALNDVRHCALSLVGEPIIYPHINKFIGLLHEKRISSFLVTNAQFPEQMDSLVPVTQLYISVDASTKEQLEKVDRPIFPDFWERFLASIDSLSKKGQRTVFRLTLIKEWNMDEVKEYSKLIKRGMPSFVEVKGVTYCGTSKASTLTMKNVPFHEEVVAFSKQLCLSDDLKDDYEISCEHEHSCGILIANKKFKKNGEWHTWIDYDKFHQLTKEGKPFTAEDYMGKSPAWCLYGSQERGFDPEETRFKRNQPYQKSGC